MRLLLFNQFFAPDPAPTGQYLADVASEAAAHGHAVSVVCSRTAYAGSGSATSRLAGVRVFETPCVRFGHGVVARLLSYASFYLGALWHGLFSPHADAVLTLTTPPMLSLIGTILKKLRGSRHYIWEMDVYPDVAVALGVLSPRSLLTRALGIVADYCRRHADGIVVLGPCVRERLIRHGLSPGKIEVVENWADGVFIRPRPFPPLDPLVLLYSGNLGLAHDTETLGAAMAQLKDDARFRFLFAGGGPRRQALETFCRIRSLANTAWMPYQEHESLPDHFAACHIGLVTQVPSSLGTVVPSKIYALMAAGRPVLFIGPSQATPAILIEKYRCGWHIEPGDADGAAGLLRLLAASPQLILDAGARAREAFVAHYDLPSGVAGILRVLGVTRTRESCTVPETQGHPCN
jgi:colanic acid biosynthesis glycosyl transferase WcaI